MIGNKISYKITKVSKNLQQSSSEAATNENDKEILIKRTNISCDKRQKIIDNLRLI